MISNISNKKLQLKAMLLALTIILAGNSCSLETEAEETEQKPIFYGDENYFLTESENVPVYPTVEEFINKEYYTEDDITVGIAMGIIVTIQKKGSPWYTYCIKDFDENSSYTPPAGFSAYEELVGIGLDENSKVTYIRGGIYHDVPTHVEQYLKK